MICDVDTKFAVPDLRQRPDSRTNKHIGIKTEVRITGLNAAAPNVYEAGRRIPRFIEADLNNRVARRQFIDIQSAGEIPDQPGGRILFVGHAIDDGTGLLWKAGDGLSAERVSASPAFVVAVLPASSTG